MRQDIALFVSMSTQSQTNLAGQKRTQFGPYMTPYPYRTALSRHFNQRTIATIGLDPNPFTVELGALRAPCGFKLNYQLPALQHDFFGIAGMA